ncbi:MAG: DUF1223 domain-containing protein [Salibacteraceae bacterium]
MMKTSLTVITMSLLTWAFSIQFSDRSYGSPESSNKKETPTAEPFVLLELYTSEGCSSCPSAEALLNEIAVKSWADRDYIYALSFHVDYWNKLGWKDQFSKREYSDRQRWYRNKFENEVVYTPQVVVNGVKEFVGSDEEKLQSAIDDAMEQTPNIYFTITPNESWTNLAYTVISHEGVMSSNANLTFNLAIVERGLRTEVKNGENEGRTLEHENVVRHFYTTTFEPDGALAPIDYTASFDEDFSIVCFVQNQESGKIMGANIWNY